MEENKHLQTLIVEEQIYLIFRSCDFLLDKRRCRILL